MSYPDDTVVICFIENSLLWKTSRYEKKTFIADINYNGVEKQVKQCHNLPSCEQPAQYIDIHCTSRSKKPDKNFHRKLAQNVSLIIFFFKKQYLQLASLSSKF